MDQSTHTALSHPLYPFKSNDMQNNKSNFFRFFVSVMTINALPFIGFGFLDNFTMIIAGDYIEHSLGMIMTISTMAAAALGNTISDVLGIGSAVYVERLVELLGIRAPPLTAIQLEMKTSRRFSNFVSTKNQFLFYFYSVDSQTVPVH